MRVERAVLDTNVLISAALQPKGSPRACVDWARRNRVELIFSQPTWAEFVTRLHKPRLDRYFPQGEREAFVADLDGARTEVAIKGLLMGCRDPEDDKVIETALVGGAEAVVTGDEDLLVMLVRPEFRVVTPRGFLDWVG